MGLNDEENWIWNSRFLIRETYLTEKKLVCERNIVYAKWSRNIPRYFVKISLMLKKSFFYEMKYVNVYVCWKLYYCNTI